MRRRKSDYFRADAVQHIYQRSYDHGVIFYTLADRLVYYSLAAVKSKAHGVRITAASIMFTHVHQAAVAACLADIREYLHDLNSSYSRLYNCHYSRQGRLFEKPPGRSQKTTLKDKRSNFIYVSNNHVEKRLCSEAVQERWSLLAYAISDHPFSAALDLKHASPTLQKAIRLVNRRYSKLKGLEYCDLEKILPSLDSTEREQFADYVISRYALVDFSYGINLFGDISQTLTAVSSTTGGEYEIREDYDSFSDTAYSEMIAYMQKSGRLKDVYSMNTTEKNSYLFDILRHTSATLYHLRKFFHEDSGACH